MRVHTCHKLWTRICEIRQNFKGDLTNSVRFSKTSLWSSPNIVLKYFFSCKKLVKTKTVCYVYFFIKCVKLSKNSVRFEYFHGNCLPDSPNSVRFYLSVRYGMYKGVI